MKKITTPFLSIIITNYNAKRFFLKLFTSLRKQTFKDFEIIFVDNRSTDDSVAYVEKNFPEVQIYVNEKDLGFSGANNVGSKKAKGEYLLLLNTDTYLDNDSLEKAINFMKKKENQNCIAQMQMQTYDKRKITDGNTYFSIDHVGQPSMSTKLFYADASGLFVKRKIFLELGGFDDAFYIYAEDVDICWRARLFGYDVKYIHEAIYYHFGGGTATASSTKAAGVSKHTTSLKRRFLVEKNILRMLLKNYELKNLIIYFPLAIILLWGEASIYLLSGKPQASLTILKSQWWNLVHLPSTLSLRKKIQEKRKISDNKILSLVVGGSSKWSQYKAIGVPNFAK